MHEQIAVNLNSLVMEASLYGGLSIQIFTGQSPKNGYMVSTYPEREKVVTHLDVLTLGEFIHDNIDLLRVYTNHLGVWVNYDEEQIPWIYLDVSTRYDKVGVALNAADAYDQLAIYDVVNQRDILLQLD